MAGLQSPRSSQLQPGESSLDPALYLLLWEVKVRSIDVDLFDGQPGHRVDAVHDFLPHGFGDQGDVDAVVPRQVQVDSRLPPPDFHGHAAGPLVRASEPAGEAGDGGASP